MLHETCPQCGTAVKEDAFFCTNCGYKLKETDEQLLVSVEPLTTLEEAKIAATIFFNFLFSQLPESTLAVMQDDINEFRETINEFFILAGESYRQDDDKT